MLRYVLRRVLWTLPTLVGITLVVFAVLSQLQASVAAAPSGQTPAQGALWLPTFVNPHPRDVRSLAEGAVDQLQRGDDLSQARGRLARLGSAALPFVLPKLDALDTEQ